jgi:putative flippase GtrA
MDPDRQEHDGVLPQPLKIKLWHKQFLRFCVVGVASTSVYIAAATVLLVVFEKTLTVANIGAFFTSLSISYLGNALWSFEANSEARSMAKFFVLCVVALTTTILIAEWVTRTGAPTYFGILFTALVIPVISFCVQKYWVFEK